MPVDPFVVHVARLRRDRGSRWHEVRRGPFDPDGRLRPPSAADSSVPAGAEAEVDVTLDSFDGGVMVTGSLRAPWEGVCRRCTAPVGGELTVRIRERFTDMAPPTSSDPLAPARPQPAARADRRGLQRAVHPGARPGWAGEGTERGRPGGGPPDDDEAYPIVDDVLDLGPMAREAIVLELPLAPLCASDCRGLCPHCGADRNEEECDCAPPRDSRWASLDVLRPTP